MSEMMADVCVDNRFELIAKYKAKLIEATNIETDKAEMDVIDNVLFRIWQMGWLDRLEQSEPLERRRGMKEYIVQVEDKVSVDPEGIVCAKSKIVGEVIRCKDCKWHMDNYCVNFDVIGFGNEDFCSLAQRKGEEE